MQLGIFDSTAGAGGDIDRIVANAKAAEADGFAHFWLPQIFSVEALSVLAILGREVPRIGLGTAVVPTFPRHPVTMAAEALTAQAASGGRVTLGIGLSHQMVIENMFGMSFSHPARHMAEYLDVLIPLVKQNAVSHQGSLYSLPVPVVIAGLGPRMLRLAGAVADGTVTWMTGPSTLAEHIVPSIRSAAAEVGRTDPRVIAALPVAVTDHPVEARAEAAKTFEIYGMLPSYRAMLDREGAGGPADVALVGSRGEVAESIASLAEVGVTDFVAVEFSTDRAIREATRQTLVGLL
jgi:F420-dependent oxidoreductase-like protein